MLLTKSRMSSFTGWVAVLAAALAFSAAPAQASQDKYSAALEEFHKAAESQEFFDESYGYALFPTVGKGGIGIGAAYGSGRVYRGGEYVGNSKLTQLSIGFQLGGQACSEIIFFKDKKAYDKFTDGNFEFGAEASAVAVTVGANAKASTSGNSAGAGRHNGGQTASASYINGMATFTAAKGGLMYEAALAGQSFSYEDK
ncbi:lipid-binding SYLF domain-containing protein [Thalassolituus sp. UBA1505]|uniref:lipid-binding SYLF domain-containing protein n=2 Tax=unclassified Thalassolituus TaxID=2624967 RepID=UPI0025F2C88E|nr:lipid-binding SYLF domain-containing protein [Thalassolituus sp. UBA1505]|tara:strand:+ start:434 stop:1030 length:597 start_codon:yes stop_codon:yes gene_type:complete